MGKYKRRFVIFGALLFVLLASTNIVKAVAGQWSASGTTIYYTDGKIGIGNSNPAGILDVGDRSLSNTTAGHLVVDEVNDKVYIGRLTTTGGGNTSNFIVRNRVGSEMLNMNINSGVTDLSGTVNLKNDGTILNLSNRAGRGMSINRVSGSTGSWEIATADDFKFLTDGVARVKIDNAGLFAREIRVNNTWADYVFEEGYELMSLEDLESFINQNGHLPNIPSADEIENGTLNLGEMQRLQMEKIEELTLYILELEERIVKLETGD